MTLKPKPLFSDGPVEIKRDEAIEAMAAAVATLSAGQLDDPSLPARLADHYLPHPPSLGTRPRYWLFEARTVERDALARFREGWAAGVELTIPFRGSMDFFRLRAGTEPLDSPKALVRPRSLVLTALGQHGDADDLVGKLDGQLEVIRRELLDQRQRCQGMRDDLDAAARESVNARRRRVIVLTGVREAFSARGWSPKRARG